MKATRVITSPVNPLAIDGSAPVFRSGPVAASGTHLGLVEPRRRVAGLSRQSRSVRRAHARSLFGCERHLRLLSGRDLENHV